MNLDLRKSVELYCDNYLELKKPLAWKANSMYIKLCAFSYTSEKAHANPDKLLEASRYIKESTGFFSYLRSARIYSAAFLTAQGEPVEKSFPRLMNCYDALKEAGFRSSTYLPVAAYALYATTPPGDEMKRATRAKEIYNGMKQLHPLLTSYEDYASAIITASLDRSISGIFDETEKTFSLLKDQGMGYFNGNGIQYLTHFLAFEDASPEVKALRCGDIVALLKQNRQKVTSMYYGAVGFLALTGKSWEEAVHDTVEAMAIMKDRGCTRLGEREYSLLLASALVCLNRSLNDESRGSLLKTTVGTTVQAVLAAQAAACAASGAAASSAASASSSN